jgi:ankyrin repeat protein
LNGELENGRTPIFEALGSNDDNAARFLIQKGAQVNHRLKEWTLGTQWRSEVFPTAVLHGASDVILDLLVDFGSKIFSSFFSGAEVSNFLSRSLFKKKAVVKKLFFHGLCSNQNLVPLLKDDHYNTIKAFLQHGVDMSKFMDELYYALGECSSTDVLSLFIQSGLDLGLLSGVPSKKVSGPAIFLAAARLGHFDAMKMLLMSGVEINYQDENGMTALHWASVCRNVNCVKHLIDFGASVTARGSVNGYEDVTPLHAAVMSNITDIMDPIIVAGADVNATCCRGTLSGITPLMIACYSTCIHSLWMFCSGYGCDINKQNSAGKYWKFHDNETMGVLKQSIEPSVTICYFGSVVH